MKVIPNGYYKYYTVDLVFDTLQRRDFKYASSDEKRDSLYSEEFRVNFDHNTHEVIEDGSGIDLMYGEECFDGFSLEQMRQDGYGDFVNSMIEKCREALYKQLGITNDEEIER